MKYLGHTYTYFCSSIPLYKRVLFVVLNNSVCAAVVLSKQGLNIFLGGWGVHHTGQSERVGGNFHPYIF